MKNLSDLYAALYDRCPHKDYNAMKIYLHIHTYTQDTRKNIVTFVYIILYAIVIYTHNYIDIYILLSIRLSISVSRFVSESVCTLKECASACASMADARRVP